MRKHVISMESPGNMKKKLASAFTMLLVSALLMTTTSYAWLVMSVAPEVTAISTSVGANGSLEIALLNTQTRQDMSSIRSGVGDSLAVTGGAVSNNTWGNLLDLSFDQYGMDFITLMPARLNAVAKEDGGYVVDSSLLSVPTYGYDGRIVKLDNNAVTAVYDGQKNFTYVLGAQDYGVRAIGTADSMSVQESALALAKSNIVTYTNSAQSKAKSSLEANGNAIFTIMLAHNSDANATYGDTDLDSLKSMVATLQESVDYIDLALRQGIIAYAASSVTSETTFESVRAMVQDTSKNLSTILADYDEVSLPDAYAEWIAKQENMENNLNIASNKCNALTGGTYTWAQFREILDLLMNTDNIYIDGVLFSDFSADGFVAGETLEMTLAPGSGVLADIADFTDNYSAIISVVIVNVEIATASAVDVPYLVALSAAVNELKAADGSDAGRQIALTSTYGYAMDIAFRCNADGGNLLLQTTPEQRIYSDSSATSTLGGGSFMEFTSADESLTIEQKIQLMDAIRVGFLDDQSNLLGVAKLNTSNRNMEDSKIKAPLYLYEYGFSEEDGSMVMGERRKIDTLLTPLEQNVAKAITVMVWLDGDLVDNTMVSATESTSLTGTLNLQFATDAELIPAANSDLMYITADKTALAAALLQAEPIVQAGQGTYTTISWNAFTSAYAYAYAIGNNDSATENQIRTATVDLALTGKQLVTVTHDALQDKIAEIRSLMGETTDLARYVISDVYGNYSGIDPYTEYQKDNKVGEIYRVDYANNLQDEGNDVLTPIYTDESWMALAAALYDAEAVDMQPNASAAQIDAAILAMDVAYKALERKVFFIPYDYNGSLYYLAISDETDTYGKWYDNSFKRIVSDLTILKLDAYAEPATIAAIVENQYVKATATAITPTIEILDVIYPELAEEEIKAIQWNTPELFNAAISQAQTARLTELKTQAEGLGVDAATIRKADDILAKGGFETKEQADAVITELEAAVDAKLAENSDEEPVVDPATESMTSDQRIVLTAAINSAKSVDGYDNAENTDLNDLRTATAAAEALLAQESGVTMAMADEALTALNTQLTACGKKEVTAYNTLTYNIPVGSEVYDVVYSVESPNTVLYLTGETGKTWMNAVILTENGVVYTATKDVTVYVAAEDAYITDGTTTQEDPTLTMTVGEETNVSAVLTNIEREVEEGETTVKVEVPHQETIQYCTWASSDTTVLTVEGSSSSCTVKALKAGTATITVSVRTVQGNIYTAEYAVTVEAAAGTGN